MPRRSIQEARDELVALVRGSRSAVAFTGAGMSTECGIPDFRSPGGFWTRHKPIYFDEFMASEDARIEAWKRKFSMDETFADARPGRGHRVVAHLVATGRMSHVITQNIDNLHQASGIPVDRVIELHGNGTYATCLTCSSRHELNWVKSRFERHSRPPGCRFCGGVIKAATVSFGQALPEAAMARAEQATLDCDLMLVLGSSLVVYPAAGFPVLAKQNGARLVIINRDPTDLDPVADLVVNGEIAEVLEPLGGLN